MPPIGFIQDDLDLKLLVLYIMARAAGPITFLQLFELALCDAGVDYFSLTQAVDHMTATGQLTKEGERYAITDKGRRNSQICESSLPRSVRRHCDDNLLRVNEALRRESAPRSSTGRTALLPCASPWRTMPPLCSTSPCWPPGGNRRSAGRPSLTGTPPPFTWASPACWTGRRKRRRNTNEKKRPRPEPGFFPGPH